MQKYILRKQILYKINIAYYSQQAKKIFHEELQSNPQFDQAFPQFQRFKQPTTVKQTKKELDFMKSLNYDYRVIESKDYEETIQENLKNFVEGYQSPSGPLKYMNEQEKIKVHAQADYLLQQLEDTGLSREEILFDNSSNKGLSLRDDPFFQEIKSNKTIRELMLKAGEEFTSQKIVELALRQDIGADPSYSKKKMESQQKNKLVDPDGYYNDNKELDVEQVTRQLSKNIKFHYMPEKKSQKRKKSLRNVNSLNIHWRNLDLISDFVNNAGKIKNRYQNRLPGDQQKKITKAIKQARNLLLLPYAGYLKASDKRSLRTLQEDVEDFSKMSINSETGHVYIKDQEPYKTVTQSKQEQFYKQMESHDLQLSSVSYTPDAKELQLIEAKLYARKLKEDQLIKQGVDVQDLKNLEDQFIMNQSPVFSILKEQSKQKTDEIDPSLFKQSFEEIHNQLMNKNDVTDFCDLFLSEKANKTVNITQNQQLSSSSKSVEELLNELTLLKKDLNLIPQETLFSNNFVENKSEKQIFNIEKN